MSISIWHNISTEKKRDELLDTNTHLRKAWKASARRYDAADDATKARLRFERSWLYTLVLDFLNVLYSDPAKEGKSSPPMKKHWRLHLHLTHLQSKLSTASASWSSSQTCKVNCQHEGT